MTAMIEALTLMFIFTLFYFRDPEMYFTLAFFWMLIAIPGLIPLFRGDPPFVPTPTGTVKKMLQLAKVKKGDIVWDTGCGDGRLVFAAAKKNAKAVGYEISIPVYLFAKISSLFYSGSEIRFGNFWTKDFHDVDVIFCYLMPKRMSDFHKVIWPQLKPGTRVVSHAFRIKELKPTEEMGSARLYVKPSQVRSQRKQKSQKKR